MFPMLRLLLALASTISLVSGNSAVTFRKCLATDDPDYSLLFKPLSNPPPIQVKHMMQCAAYAQIALNKANKLLRASAYFYAPNNQTCTLGRTPIFDNQVVSKATIKEDCITAAHALVGKKPILNENDPFVYIIINEERMFLNLFNGTAPDRIPGYYRVTDDIIYNQLIQSPVQTLEGQYAGTLNSFAFFFLQYRLPTKWTLRSFTVLVWYRNGYNNGNGNEPLVAMGLQAVSNVRAWTTLLANANLPLDMKLILNNGTNTWGPQINTTGAVLANNQWNYIGATFDGNTGSVTFFVNGSIVLSQNASVTKLPYDIQADEFNIAGFWEYQSNNYIASVEVYNRTLNQVEVAEAMVTSTTTRVLVV